MSLRLTTRPAGAALCALTLAAAAVATAAPAGAATTSTGGGLLTAAQVPGYTSLGAPTTVKLPTRAAKCGTLAPKGSTESIAIFEKGKPSATGGSILLESLVRTPSVAAAHAYLLAGEASVRSCGTTSQTLGSTSVTGKASLHSVPAVAGSAGGVAEVVTLSVRTKESGATVTLGGQIKALIYQAGKDVVVVSAIGFTSRTSGKNVAIAYSTTAAQSAAAAAAAKAAVATALKG